MFAAGHPKSTHPKNLKHAKEEGKRRNMLGNFAVVGAIEYAENVTKLNSSCLKCPSRKFMAWEISAPQGVLSQ